MLTVLTEPAGSSVELTYLSGPTMVRRPYEEPIKLPTGAIDLKARSLNFQSETKRVQLPSTGAKVSFKLERLEREEGALFSDVIKGIGENAPDGCDSARILCDGRKRWIFRYWDEICRINRAIRGVRL